MRYCVVFGCGNMGNHRLPTNDKLRAEWIRAAKLDRNLKPGKKLSIYTYICSNHFKESDFNPSFQLFDGDLSKKKLKADAVPSIFPWTAIEEKEYDIDVTFRPDLMKSNYTRNIIQPTTFVGATSFGDLDSKNCVLDPLDGQGIKRELDLDSSSMEFNTVKIKTEFLVEFPSCSGVDVKSNDTSATNFKDFSEVCIKRECTESNSYENASTAKKPCKVYTNKAAKLGGPSFSSTEPKSFKGAAAIIVKDFSEELQRCSGIDLKNHIEASSQTISMESKIASTQTVDTVPRFSVQTYRSSDKAIHFYTGLLTFNKLRFAFKSLGKNVNNLKYFYGRAPKLLDPFEQFFLTLMLLRRHYSFQELSIMYLITIKSVANIVITWIKFMANKWRSLDIMLCNETVEALMPSDFISLSPQAKFTLSTEGRPSNQSEEIIFYTYKNKDIDNTFKFIVGIAPNSLITYVSPCYCTSDWKHNEKNEAISRFVPNDVKTILCESSGVEVQVHSIPEENIDILSAFFKQEKYKPPKLMKNTGKVPKITHVEKIIALLKTYKIMTEPLKNTTENILSNDIVFVCSMLINFRTRGCYNLNMLI